MISIVTPVYNSESFIEEMIVSILRQTYADWELILVDDGSADTSFEIMESHAAHDSRIKAVHSLHKGVSAARNIGLESANGEWLMFVDSDDMLIPDALRTALDNSDGVDVVNFGMQGFPVSERTYPYNVHDRITFDTYEQTADSIRFLFENGFHGLICNKMIRRDKIRFFFDESTASGEDTIFAMSVLPEMHGFRIIPEKLYLRREHGSDSLSRKFFINSIDVYEKEYLLLVNGYLKKDKVCEYAQVAFARAAVGYFLSLCHTAGMNEIILSTIIEEKLQGPVLGKIGDFHMEGMTGRLLDLWAALQSKNVRMIIKEFGPEGDKKA